MNTGRQSVFSVFQYFSNVHIFGIVNSKSWKVHCPYQGYSVTCVQQPLEALGQVCRKEVMFSRDLPLTWETSHIEQSNRIFRVKDSGHESLSSGMVKVVRKLVWSKGILLLAGDADSTFNWFSHGLLAVGSGALCGALSFIYFKNVYQTLTLCQALFWELGV